MLKAKRKCKACGKMFTPEHDTKTVKQLVCKFSCCVLYYNKQKPKSRKLARIVASMVGRRSMGEVRFDAECIEGKKSVQAEYEPDSFQYKVEETKSYTPDYKVQTRSGKTFYIEYKGVLDLETRKKMVRVKQQHPDLDIRFVFQKAANKIRKGSPTTYGMWAEKEGFQWHELTIPRRWLT